MPADIANITQIAASINHNIVIAHHHLYSSPSPRSSSAFRPLAKPPPREGIPRRPVAAEEADARALFKALAGTGGAELVGPSQELDPGLYYRPALRGD